jgi:methionyl-tRNA formyltransferase
MGTPAFAVPTLQWLLSAHDVMGVFTQPDRPAGRGRRLTPSPVKGLALAHGVPVFQPASLRKDEGARAVLAELAPDVLVVAAYGLLLPPAVLGLATGGALNVHASLLPRWRGAAPVAHALLAGDAETGVTIMLLDEGMDTGPMLGRLTVPIAPADTTGTLTDRLARHGAELLAEVLPAWLAGELEREPQDAALATLAPRLTVAEGRLDWRQDAAALSRRVRAMSPWPGAYTHWGAERLKIHRATAVPAGADGVLPGTVLDDGGLLLVATGSGRLRLDELQAPGGRPLAGPDFARGRRDLIGAVLGAAEPEPR